jgi:hypothetical protein
MDIRSTTTIGKYGTTVGRWDDRQPIPAGHHVETVRAGEYWLVKTTISSEAAAALGRLGGLKGGTVKSRAKAKAAKANGAKGGRPTLVAVVRAESDVDRYGHVTEVLTLEDGRAVLLFSDQQDSLYSNRDFALADSGECQLSDNEELRASWERRGGYPVKRGAACVR